MKRARAQAAAAALARSVAQKPLPKTSASKFKWPKIRVKTEISSTILISIVLAGAEMSWELRLVLFFFAFALSVDLIRHINRANTVKIAGMALAFIILSATFLPKTYQDFITNTYKSPQNSKIVGPLASQNSGEMGSTFNNYDHVSDITPSSPGTSSDGCSFQSTPSMRDFTVIKTNPTLSIFDLDGSKCADLRDLTIDGPGNDISARDSFGLKAQNIHLNANWPSGPSATQQSNNMPLKPISPPTVPLPVLTPSKPLKKTTP